MRTFALAAASVVVVAALVPLRDHVRNANLALALVLIVLAAAVIGGRRAGVVIGITVAVAFDFFLTQPYQSFTIEEGADVQTTVLLALVGLVGGELVERARRGHAEAERRRLQVERLHRRAELAALGERPGRLIARFEEELIELLGLVEATYHPGPPPSDVSVLTHAGVRIPGVPSTAGDHVVTLPVRAHGRDLGHLLLVFPHGTTGVSMSVDDRHTAVALADQLGVALLRYED